MENWISRFIEEERLREKADVREAAAIARQIANDRVHLRSLLNQLSEQVASDVSAFAREFPDRALSFEGNPLNGGFTVRRGHYPEVKLSVDANMNAGTIEITYVVSAETGTQTLKPRFLELGGHASGSLHFRDEPGQQTFRTITQLSEHLLVPVFTGRPR
jgi:hypothetical protein